MERFIEPFVACSLITFADGGHRVFAGTFVSVAPGEGDDTATMSWDIAQSLVRLVI